MTTYQYIILRNSTEQAQHDAAPETHHGKKFKVVFGMQYRPFLRKIGSISETIGGRIDFAPGPIFEHWQGTIRCTQSLPTQDVTDGFGTLSDLEAYFKLNNPTGTPNNRIVLVDHLGSEHVGYLVGEFSVNPMTIVLEGNFAHYFIMIQFVEREAVG